MNMQCTLQEMISKFDVQATGDSRFVAHPLSGGRGAVDASQILAQSMVAASKTEPHKFVQSIHMLFSRVASDREAIELEVDTMHSGRSFSSVTVTARQAGRLCARALILMDTNEPDLIRYQVPMPDVISAAQAHPLALPVTGRELRVVEEFDLMDPEDVGPAELNVWLKYDYAPAETSLNNALVAHLSNHFSIATAMRPHKGISQSMAHRSLSCGVLSLTVHFFQPKVKVDQWLLYSHQSPSAGRGLSCGQANIFTQDGQLIACFTQENMIRALPVNVDHSLKERDQLL